MPEPLRQREPRVRDEAHLRLVRQCPCVCCVASRGRIHNESEAAHVRFGDPDYLKRPTGMAEKPSDQWTVPLCDVHHRHGNEAQHSMGEQYFWRTVWGIDPLALALELFTAPSLDDMRAAVIQAARSAKRRK